MIATYLYTYSKLKTQLHVLCSRSSGIFVLDWLLTVFNSIATSSRLLTTESFLYCIAIIIFYASLHIALNSQFHLIGCRVFRYIDVDVHCKKFIYQILKFTLLSISGQ